MWIVETSCHPLTSGHQNQDIPKLAVTVSLFSSIVVVQLYKYQPRESLALSPKLSHRPLWSIHSQVRCSPTRRSAVAECIQLWYRGWGMLFS